MSASQYYVHPNALCETDQIGSGTRIWAFAHVMSNVVIGADCNIGDHAFVESGVRIGDRVTVKNGVAIWDGVTVADDVFLGPNCVLTNDLFPRSRVYHDTVVPTRIERGASVGANATIIAGVTLGEFCLVGAGSVVNHDVAPFALVVGMPARRIGWVGVRGERLALSLQNPVVENENGRYALVDGVVRFTATVEA